MISRSPEILLSLCFEQCIRVFEAAMMMSYSALCVNGRAASNTGSHLPSLTASLERRWLPISSERGVKGEDSPHLLAFHHGAGTLQPSRCMLS